MVESKNSLKYRIPGLVIILVIVVHTISSATSVGSFVHIPSMIIGILLPSLLLIQKFGINSKKISSFFSDYKIENDFFDHGVLVFSLAGCISLTLNLIIVLAGTVNLNGIGLEVVKSSLGFFYSQLIILLCFFPFSKKVINWKAAIFPFFGMSSILLIFLATLISLRA